MRGQQLTANSHLKSHEEPNQPHTRRFPQPRHRDQLCVDAGKSRTFHDVNTEGVQGWEGRWEGGGAETGVLEGVH